MPVSDPFAPPSDATDDAPLADLGSRFVAKLIDGAIAMIPLVIAGVLIVPFVGEPGDDPPPIAMIIMLLGLCVVFAIQIYQWVQISSTGQSIGKGLVGIRIVKVDGSPVDFISGVIIRMWVPNAVAGLLNQCCLGWIVWIADVIPALQPDRRTIHDHLAGTKVIVAGT